MAVGVELCHSAGQRRQSLPSPAHSHFIIIVIIVVAGYSQGPSLSSAVNQSETGPDLSV